MRVAAIVCVAKSAWHQARAVALAGINAHINHDLPVALVQTGKAMRIVPKRGTPEFRDF